MKLGQLHFIPAGLISIRPQPRTVGPGTWVALTEAIKSERRGSPCVPQGTPDAHAARRLHVTDTCHLPEPQLQMKHEGTLRAPSEPGTGRRTRARAAALSDPDSARPATHPATPPAEARGEKNEPTAAGLGGEG